MGSRRGRAILGAALALLSMGMGRPHGDLPFRPLPGPHGGIQVARDVIVRPDGSIVAAGLTRLPAATDRAHAQFPFERFTVGTFPDRKRCDGTQADPAPSGDAFGLALHSSGDVFAVGEMSALPTVRPLDERFTVRRMQGDDLCNVVASYPGPGSDVRQGAALQIVVRGDDVVVAGRSRRQRDLGLRQGFTVIKFDPSLQTEWTFTPDEATAESVVAPNSEARALAVDRDGNVLAAGFVRERQTGRTDWAVFKIDGRDGSELWRMANADGAPDDEEPNVANDLPRRLSKPFFGPEFLDSLPYDGLGISEAVDSLAVSPDGDVVVGGYFASVQAVRDPLVRYLDGHDGHEVWSRQLDGDANLYGRVFRVAFAPDGGVIAAGYVRPGRSTYSVMTIAKWNGAGVPQWTAHLGTSGGDALAINRAFGLAIDETGDVVVSGEVTGIERRDHAVLRLGPRGEVRWCKHFDSEQRGLERFTDDLGRAVALDAHGDVFSAGSLGGRFTVLHLDGATGASSGNRKRGRNCRPSVTQWPAP